MRLGEAHGGVIPSAFQALGLPVFMNHALNPVLNTTLAARLRHLPIIDIGVHQGDDLTIPAARLGHTVFGFEPTPATYAKWIHNLRANSISFSQNSFDKASVAAKGHVFAFNMAVANYSGTAEIFSHPQHGVANSLARQALPTILLRSAERTVVNVTTLDSVLQFHNGDVFLLKIDSQGFEYHILKGALNFIATHGVYIIMLEFYPKGLSAAGVNPLDLLYMLHNKAGFQCFDTGRFAKREALSLEAFVAAYPNPGRNVKMYGKFTDLLCLNRRLANGLE